MSAGVDRSLGVPIARVSNFKYALGDPGSIAEAPPIKDLPAGSVERMLRLHLRTLLNQNNGTFDVTNAIADDLARVLMRDFKVEVKR